MVNTKIIATIGPASNDRSALRRMMLAGMDMARLNFSHGTHQAHESVVRTIRGLNKQYRRKVKILQDLEGYRIRVGHIARPLELKKNAVVTMHPENKNVIKGTAFPIDLTGSFKLIMTGETIYIDDGKIVLKVMETSAQSLRAKVVIGGILQSRKGINISNFKVPVSSLTEKDRRDLDFAVRHELDYVAQSFVRTKEDIVELKDVLKSRGYIGALLAKIESQEGVNNVEEIIDASEGIIVARGDLGITVSLYRVPLLQKHLIAVCRRKKKISVVATQMLESMTQNQFPTRAEVSDVANAVLDGADMLLLSGETAAGKYPVEAIQVMNTIIKEVEKSEKVP